MLLFEFTGTRICWWWWRCWRMEAKFLLIQCASDLDFGT